MTRSQNKLKTKEQLNTPIAKRVENTWILLAKESLLQNKNFRFISLPHPATGKLTKYCLEDVTNKMFEVVTYNEPHRSWFIGETVKSDPSMQILTPINPLFLILPKVKSQCTSKAVPLEDLLSDKGYDQIVNTVKDLEKIADRKGPVELKAYKYNEEKTYKWLEDRIRNLAKVLKEKNLHVTAGAVSATFVSSNLNNVEIEEEFYLKYAHGLLSEYLQEEFVQNLEKRLNFRPELIETIGMKRKSEINDLHENTKKIKLENSSLEEVVSESTFTQSFTENKKNKTLSAKEKARQKAASGMKTISSFFTKK